MTNNVPKCIDTPAKRAEWEETNDLINKLVGYIKNYKHDMAIIRRTILRKEAELRTLRRLRDEMKTGKRWQPKRQHIGYQTFVKEEDV